MNFIFQVSKTELKEIKKLANKTAQKNAKTE